MTCLTLVNTDPEIANLLQYGIEGTDYILYDDTAVPVSEHFIYGLFGLQNKRITYRYGMEPENKKEVYAAYIRENLNANQQKTGG